MVVADNLSTRELVEEPYEMRQGNGDDDEEQEQEESSKYETMAATMINDTP